MKRSVLYIEDNANNIRLVERLVGRRPETTLHVETNALDGCRAAVEMHPNLILLDNRLPDATGADVLGRLAAGGDTAGLPVVIVTGDADKATADQLVALGAREVIVKPFDLAAFSEVLNRYLP